MSSTFHPDLGDNLGVFDMSHFYRYNILSISIYLIKFNMSHQYIKYSTAVRYICQTRPSKLCKFIIMLMGSFWWKFFDRKVLVESLVIGQFGIMDNLAL